MILLKNEACHFASVSNEKECPIDCTDYSTGKLGKLKLVTKKEITDKKREELWNLHQKFKSLPDMF